MAYRVLIIGCGAIAGGYDAGRQTDAWPLTHAGAFGRDERFEVAGCIDPDDAARLAFAERWRVARHARSLAELEIETGAFDVISICSPTELHAGHLEAATALRPRLIFCEKPVAGALDEAEMLVRACTDAGVSLAVNHTRRWAPDLVMLAGEVRSGAWGRVQSATGWYAKGAIHNGGHMVDLLGMFLGAIDLVSVGAPVFDCWDADPTVPALLVGEKGANIHLAAGDARSFTQFELVLNCEKGEIAMRDGGFRVETRRVKDSDEFAGYRTLGECATAPGRYDEAMSLAVANIADHLARSKPLASTGENALAAQRLCEAMRIASLARQKDFSTT